MATPDWCSVSTFLGGEIAGEVCVGEEGGESMEVESLYP